MATKTPFPFSKYVQIENEKISALIEWYEMAQKDEDKASSIDDMYFYEGTKVGYFNVLCLLLNVPEGKANAYWNGKTNPDMLGPNS